jgi:hypothetical protein
MPFPQVPSEIRDKYAQIYEQIKKNNPNWSKEKIAKVTWSTIKKLYHKEKDGKWHPNEKTSQWLYDDKNFASTIDLVARLVEKDVDGETIIGSAGFDDESILEITGPVNLIRASDISVLVQADPKFSEQIGDWRRKLVEQAGFNYDEVGSSLKEADYLYLDNWLCHADIPNNNKLEFSHEDLQQALQLGQFSPYKPVIVDVNHSEVPALGFVLGAYLVPDERADNALGLRVISVLLNWGPYQDAGKQILESIDKNELMFSMSCYPEYCTCKKCGYLSRSRWDSCEHVLDMNDKEGILLAHHPKFLTNSLILPPHKPADRLATPVEITAADKIEINASSMEEIMEIKELQAKFDELSTQYEEAMAKIKTLESVQQTKETEAKIADLEAKVSGLTKDLETAQAKIVELEESNKAQATQIEALTSEKSELQKTVDESLASEKAKTEAAAEEKIKSRDEAIAKLLPEMEDAEKAYYHNRAQNDSDSDWGILVSTLTKLQKSEEEVPPDTTDPVVQAKLNASALLGSLKNAALPTTEHLSGLAKAVDKNII